jgi:dihydroxyacid dehydratase/phosphogluconate dehydratase
MYGEEFDDLAHKWAVIENQHDKLHPDRDQCGGVGDCSMMFTANVLESEMTEALHEWRKRATSNGRI